MALKKSAASAMAVENEAEMSAGDAEPPRGLRDDRNAFLLLSVAVSCNDHESGFNPFLIVSQQQNDILTRNFCRALERARGERSQAEFARYLGIPAQQTYQRYESGQTVPDGLVLHRIATRLGVTLDALFEGSDTTESVRVREEPPAIYRIGTARMIPVISWAHAGEAEEYEEIPREWQREIATSCRDQKAFGLELRGDSMLPKYNEGDVAIVMPGDRPHGDGLVIAKLKDNGVCFKVYSTPSKGLIRLTSYNPVYPPLDRTAQDFHWIYPVYEVRSYLQK